MNSGPAFPLRRAARFLLAAAAVLLAADGARAQAAAPADGVLGPGDVLRIVVHQRPELSGEIEVGAEGTLVHPLYRHLNVTGLARPELEARLETFLRQYQERPAFVAEPMVRVMVAGEVRTPGLQTVPPGLSLFRAVAQAGGANDRGRLSRVVLMRDNGTQTLDLSRPDAPGSRQSVRSGDVLVVGRRPATLREYVAPIASVAAVIVSILNLVRPR